MLAEILKNCLTKVLAVIQNLLHIDSSIAHEDSSSEITMAQRMVKLTEENYNYLVKRWPEVNPAIIKVSKPGTDIFYETEVAKVSRIEDIPLECIDYIRSLKLKQNNSGKKSKSTKPKNKLLGSQKTSSQSRTSQILHKDDVIELNKTIGESQDLLLPTEICSDPKSNDFKSDSII